VIHTDYGYEARGPKGRNKHRSYNETVDEAPELIDEEPVDVEQESPADGNESIEGEESEDDEWPAIVDKIKTADVVIFATPIWWGGHSSLMQRVIERMDAFDEEFMNGGRSVLLNKVAGIVITGSEDGAQSTMARLMSTLSFFNFTLPPQCCVYWVGEVGMDPKSDAERRKQNRSVTKMAERTAKSLVHYSKLLKQHPLEVL